MSDEQQRPIGLSEARPIMPRATNILFGLFFGAWFADLLVGGQLTPVGLLVPAFVVAGAVELLIWPSLLAASFPQLLLNIVFILLIGPPAERIFGRGRLLVAYFLSCLAGGIFSAALLPGEAVATASAGLLGILGLLLGVMVFRQGAMTQLVESRMAAVLGVGLLLHMLFGELEPFSNSVLNIAGLLTGFLLAAAFEPLTGTGRQPALALFALLVLPPTIGGFFYYTAETTVGTLGEAMLRSEADSLIGDMAPAIGGLEQALFNETGSTVMLLEPFAQNELAWFYVTLGRRLERGIDLSEDSLRALPNEHSFLDTVGYLYAMTGRCRDAKDALARAVEVHGGYERRREEVNRACEEGRIPNPELPVDPLPPEEELEAAPTPDGFVIRADVIRKERSAPSS